MQAWNIQTSTDEFNYNSDLVHVTHANIPDSAFYLRFAILTIHSQYSKRKV